MRSRILDTRNPNGTYGGPSLAGQGSRSFPVFNVCGIPTTAKALALNVTTTDSTAATGNVRLYPTGLSYQPLGTSNAYKISYPRANQTFGSIDGPTAGSFTLFNDAGTAYSVNVIVDVTGYFAPGPGAPPPTGDSWFFTLRDANNRPSVEYRWDSATSTATLLKDHAWFGNLHVADYAWQGQPDGLVYFTNDHLGSPRLMTQGTVPVTLATYKYRAFGLNLSSTLPGQGLDFAGMERDVASSDLYDHARYLGGRLSRFKSPDQLGGHVEDPQSWNRYSYARNNPLKYVDPDGRDALWVNQPGGRGTLVIPVHFTGSGATPANIATIRARVESLRIPGIDNGSLPNIVVVPTEKAVSGVLNTMDFSPGLNQKMCGAAGECVNRLGGTNGHIDSGVPSGTDAAAHDILHFAGIKDQYAEGPRDEKGNRTSTPKAGYDESNIMTSRNGTDLKPTQLQEGISNPTTKQCTVGSGPDGVTVCR